MIRARHLPEVNDHFTDSHGSLERRQLTHNVRLSDMAVVEAVEKTPVYVRNSSPFGIRDYLLATGHPREADEIVSGHRL